jgi:hypothetical protein
VSDFKPGEIVDITITGARVIGVDGNGIGDLEVSYSTDLGTYEAVFAIDTPAVNVARVAPAEWPPQVGDVWRDTRGETHWVTGSKQYGAEHLYSRDGKGHRPDVVNQRFGPLTLVHREAVASDG